MASQSRPESSILAKGGWAVLLAISALMLLHAIFWIFEGPAIALESIARRTSLTPEDFNQGSPSAFDVIALTERNFAIVEAALAAVVLLIARGGFRPRSSSAWGPITSFVAALGAMAINFALAGGLQVAVSYFIGAGVALVGLVLIRTGPLRDRR